MTETIYHITAAAAASAAQRSGQYVPEGFAQEGFIHCSYAHQIHGVLQRFFHARKDIVLLEIDRSRLSGRVVDENLEGGAELFPHIYGPLQMPAVVRIRELLPDIRASFAPATVKAVRIHANGGPEVLQFEETQLPLPGRGDARIRHTAIALNFSDVNVRRGGFYVARPLRFPVILGNEAAGIVESVGPGVTQVAAGDRVCYVGAGGPFYENTGAYAEARNLPASCLIKLPESISEQQAAAAMLKGLTASMIVNRIFRPKAGDTILIHGAASGVGLLLCQWSKYLGATVIGTIGSKDKSAVVEAHGCDHPILYRQMDFVKEVRRICPEGVAAVFDGVGKDTFEKSLYCTRPFGMIVNYGNTSGHPPPLDLMLLAKRGSLSVNRPGVNTYQSDPNEYANACAELFDLIAGGILKIEISRIYPLYDAAQAHRDMEDRKTIGSILLAPNLT